MPDGRTLVAADWVVPITAPPVPDGAVLVEGERVVAVGPESELAAAAPDAAVTRFMGGVVMPGIVNAHTHLSLTALEGAAAPAAFDEWLGEVVPRIMAMEPETIAASAKAGVQRMLEVGVTAVGDITYRDESVPFAIEGGLAAVAFREVLGMPDDRVEPFLAETGFPPSETDRVRAALSAHAPYSTGPGAIRETVRVARESGMPCVMHVAESPAEEDLIRRGEGPFARLASRQAPDFVSPGTGTVEYLDSLGVLDDLICVHAVHVTPSDIDLLAEKACGVVLCPRSNLYLDCGDAPVGRLAASGVPLALGTDSLASNRDFDMFAEARALLEIDPGLSRERVVRMMTAEGADVLGLPGHGRLEAGSWADLVVVRLGATDDPVRDLLGAARARDIDAVMSAGVWRTR